MKVGRAPKQESTKPRDGQEAAPELKLGARIATESDLMQTLIANLPDAAYVKDDHGRILASNPVMARFMGAPDPQSLLGKTDFDFYPRGLAEKYRQDEEKLIGTGLPLLNADEPRPGSDGSTVHILTTKVPLRDEKGKVIGLVGVSRDITDLRLAEEELRRSEERHRALFQTMREGFAYCRMLFKKGRPTDFIYLEVNAAFEALTGLKNVIGKKVTEVIPGIETSNPELLEAYGRVALTGTPEKLEVFLHPLKKWLSISAYSPLKNHFVAVFENITPSKLTEMALSESEQSFRSLFENATIGIYRTTPDGRILMANPSLIQMLGYDSFEELASRNLEREGYEPGYARSEFKSRFGQSDVVRGLESAWKRKDGSTIFVRESARLMRDGTGNPLYYVGAVEDVTERKKTEEALAAERGILRTIIDSLPDNVFIKDGQGRIILDNIAHRRFLGHEHLEEVVGKTDLDFFKPELAEVYMHDERLIVESAQPLIEHEEPSVDPGGEARWLLTTKVPVRDSRGKVTALVGINRDVTERKLVEEALLNNEKKFRTMFDSASDAIFIADSNGRFLEVNRVACERLGYTREELLDMTPADIDTALHAALVEDRLARVRQTGSAIFETEQVTRDGRIIPTEISSRMIDYEGRPAMLSLARDISERKRAEEALRDSEERFRKVFEEGPLGMVLTNRDMRFIKTNPAFCQMLGYTEGELSRMTFLDITHQDHQGVDKENITKLWQGKIAQYRTEKRYVTKSGEIRWGSISSSLLQGRDDSSLLALAMIEDITERKRAEEELRRLGLRHQAILAAVPDIIMEVDTRKVYTWSNAAGLTFFGPDVIGREAAFYFEGEQDTYEKVEPLFKGNTNLFYVESWQRRKDGEKRLLGWWCKTLRDTQGNVTGALSSARDITPQKQAELALRESEQKYRDLVENINDIIYSVDKEGRVVYASPAVERVTGYTPDEIRGDVFLDHVVPEDRPHVQSAWPDILKGNLYPSEYRLRKKDGSICWVRTSSRPLLSDKGEFQGFTGSMIEITDRKRVEQDIERHRQHLEELVRERTAQSELAHHRLEQVLHAAGEGIFGVDTEGRITFINEAGARMLGWTVEELLTRDLYETFHPTNPDGTPRTATNRLIMDTVKAGTPHSESEEFFQTKDGHRFPVEFISSPIGEKGLTLGAVVVFHDIADRKRAEEEKKDYTEELERFNRAMVDREKRIIEVKEEVNRLCQELGREPKYPAVWR